MWLTIFVGAIPTNGVGAPPFKKWPPAGTGPEQSDGRRGGLLHELRLDELNRIAETGIAAVKQKVRSVRSGHGLDPDEIALLIYWDDEDY